MSYKSDMNMIDRNKVDGIFRKLIVVIPIQVNIALSLFISGKIISMPVDFPYSRGIWNVIGIAVILILAFITAFLAFVIGKKIKK